ncbi:hypothetical protein [Streptomyces sp. BV129]|uniref:hypothetical protein n=1 Tax=Streptomyces sp. BV129 TaxID=2849671 RepID=UPI001C2E9D16|nr:hypothetical protein [Streptomyces sp. BV129]MBV1949362.1 hypothetical protein [Streptomyces sp. BV129]MBV1949483.1 hypothetical protein [Streptomyces sp. BV129]
MKIYWSEPTSSSNHPAVAALRAWFDHLDHRAQDLVLRHVCAKDPVPLTTLAHDHAIPRQDLRRRRNQLPASLDDALDTDAAALSAVMAIDKELQIPTQWRDVVRRHPWLAVTASDQHGITTLQILLGLRWPDALQDTWMFDGDLSACAAATLGALQLEPQEMMSLGTARRRLDETLVPAPPDEAQLQHWLTYCGLTCHPTAGGGLVSTTPHTDASTTDRDQRDGVHHIESETPYSHRSLPHALLRISTLLYESPTPHTNMTLSDVLVCADELHGELGQLARCVRDAVTTTPGTWALGVGTSRTAHLPTSPTPTAHAAARHHSAPDAQERLTWLERLAGDLQHLATTHPSDRLDGAASASACDATPLGTNDARAQWLDSLRHDIREVLLQVRTPMSAGEIAALLQRRVRLKTLRDILRNDPHIITAGHDRWALALLPPEEPNPHPASAPSARLTRQLDTVVQVLTDADRPLSTAELKECARLSMQLAYLKQRLDADPRFQRSAKDQWALTEWELPVYKPMKELVGDLIDTHGGAIDAEEVIRRLLRDFGVKEASLRQVMSSPPFTARGGVVRRLADVEAEQHTRTPDTDTEPADDDAPTADDLIKGMGLI